MAAVVEDLVDAETVEILRSTSDESSGLTGCRRPAPVGASPTPPPGTIRGPIQVAIIALFVVVCFAVGLVAGSSFGLVVLALGVAIVAAMARRHRRPTRRSRR